VRPLAEVQQAFAAALRDPQRPIPRGCVDPDGNTDAKRFAVYRNNVASSLIDCLAEGYPAVRRLLGEEYFRETARMYAAQNLPRSPVMLEYGDGFPVFLEQFEPLAELPYLADVARIERAWLEAYHAAEAAPLDPAALAEVPADRAGDLCLTLHPSVRLVRSPFPALSIWHTNIADAEVQPIDLEALGEDVLVARPQADVQARTLPAGGAVFLDAVMNGETLSQAAGSAVQSHAEFNLTDHLTAILQAGLVIAGRLKRRRSRGH
jgi:hypothetical protein